MKITTRTTEFSVSPQIQASDMAEIKALGFRTILCNRPDGEAHDQPPAETIKQAAEEAGLAFAYLPLSSPSVSASDAAKMATALQTMPAPVLAYCRSGTRSTALFNAAHAQATPPKATRKIYDVVIVGGGSAGIATAAALHKRDKSLSIAIIEPSDTHYYQPGWTLVGAGILPPNATARPMARVIPAGVKWFKAEATEFTPDENRVVLANGDDVSYRALVLCPGLMLDWAAIPGLNETLGRNNVTSNYRFDLAPYTQKLTEGLKSGRALFTQPPMPIKCAGAPQKAMYLSCDTWRKAGTLNAIDVEFHNAGAVLFGVAAYVPALMEYVKRYNVNLQFESKLVGVDGPARIARFEQKNADGTCMMIERPFDMLHVVPPQRAPDFIKNSPFAAASGYVDVDEASLQHPVYKNVFGLGDACTTSNAKTAAAVRQQAPVVAGNILAFLQNKILPFAYSGYGSCPLTVERNKIVLAEFSYGGKITPTFPTWLLNGTRPTRTAWFLKETILPRFYWHGMLKGREWLMQKQDQNNKK